MDTVMSIVFFLLICATGVLLIIRQTRSTMVIVTLLIVALFALRASKPVLNLDDDPYYNNRAHHAP